MSDEIVGSDGWPTVSGLDAAAELERKKLIVAALIDEEKARRKASADEATAELALTQKMQDSLSALAIAGIDRARAGAQFVQTAAGAIGGFYTGILALIYVSDAQLPARGIIPTLFLGASVALAAYYLAFIGAVRSWERPVWTTNPNEDAWNRLNYITRGARSLAYARAGALRAGVVCLLLGLLTLPIAVVTLPALDLGGSSLITISRVEKPPAAAPAVLDWPEPTILPDPSLSVVLYQAQLDEFRAGLVSKAPAPDESGQDRFAIALAVLGFIVASLVWFVPDIWRRLRGDRTPRDRVVEPAAAE